MIMFSVNLPGSQSMIWFLLRLVRQNHTMPRHCPPHSRELGKETFQKGRWKGMKMVYSYPTLSLLNFGGQTATSSFPRHVGTFLLSLGISRASLPGEGSGTVFQGWLETVEIYGILWFSDEHPMNTNDWWKNLFWIIFCIILIIIIWLMLNGITFF